MIVISHAKVPTKKSLPVYQLERALPRVGVVLCAALSPNGMLLATGLYENEINLLDVLNLEIPIVRLVGHTAAVCAVAFSRNGEFLESGSSDKVIRLWSALSGTCTLTLEGYDWTVRALVFSEDGLGLYSASDNKSIRVWNLESKSCVRVLSGHSGRVASLSICREFLLLLLLMTIK